MDLNLLGLLGALIGVGFFAFSKVRRSTVGTRRENKIKVEGQRKVEAIEKQAQERRDRVQEEIVGSRGKDPSDVIGGLIDRGDISK